MAAEAVSEPKKPKKSSAKSKADSINMTPKESSVAPHAHVARSMPDYGAVRDILLAMRREALGDLRQEPRRTEEESRAGGDIYDQASDERDRELSLLMSERERAKLASIDDALSRIKDGSYGECESCGEMIPIGRLKVMPFAIFCVDCQSQAELDAKREAFYGEGINAFGGLDSESEAEG
ncbi:MAG: TraR/DksA family transcriptional regulator [Myxococcales bacterium]|nr:TraR/DksA family transcriptional regulator [Myxococcales bacterium]